MSFTTLFTFTHTSALPLPSVRPGQHDSAISQRGLSVALSLLHSPSEMINFNPLVEKFTQLHPPSNTPLTYDPDASTEPEDPMFAFNKIASLANTFNVSLAQTQHPDEWTYWHIIDKFPMMFGAMTKMLEYRAALRNHPDGMESISDPGSGVALHGRWTVTIDEARPGYLKLVETVRCTCNLFLGPVVRSQLGGAHEKLHFEFGRRFVEIMKGDMRSPGAQSTPTMTQTTGTEQETSTEQGQN